MKEEALRTLCNRARTELDRLSAMYQGLLKQVEESQNRLETCRIEIISAQSVWAAYATALGEDTPLEGVLSQQMLNALKEPKE